jgi:hypothetical protein
MVFSNLASSWCSVSCGVMVFQLVCVLRGVLGGLCHCLLAVQRANPSSRRKEKASRTEKFLLACWCCLQPQLPSRHKT